jgi:hypothetical protein
MGWAGVNYREIRFVIDDDLTYVYVLCEALGDCPIGVQGWHFKAFPASLSTVDILTKKMWVDGKDSDPVLWPQKAPERN